MEIEQIIPPSVENIEEANHIKALENEEQEIINNKNKSIMNTGTFTSTVKHIANAKVWGEGSKQTTYYDLEMTDGNKINIGKKITLQQGDSLSYEVTEISQQEYCKAKSWNPEYDNNNSSSQPEKPYVKPSGNGQQASFGLSYAKDQIIAFGLEQGVEPTVDNIADATHALADKHLEWLKSKS